MNPLLVVDIGRTKYADAWALQRRLFALRQDSLIDDVLLLTEHDHVYTFGKGSDRNHLLASESELTASGIETFQIDRGGDVTYHGPGQIVAYPLIDLKKYFQDIHRYVRTIEEAVIHTLASYAISAGREEGLTGVWVQGEKIAAIGIKVSKWVTMHGVALNVNPDLSKFDRIIPCGIFHKGVTSMQRVLKTEVPIEDVRRTFVHSFSNLFGCTPQWEDKKILESRAAYSHP